MKLLKLVIVDDEELAIQNLEEHSAGTEGVCNLLRQKRALFLRS